jgi:hypothetical protein
MIWQDGPPTNEGWFWLEIKNGWRGIYQVGYFGQLDVLFARGISVGFPADTSMVYRHAGPIAEPVELMGVEGEA